MGERWILLRRLAAIAVPISQFEARKGLSKQTLSLFGSISNSEPAMPYFDLSRLATTGLVVDGVEDGEVGGIIAAHPGSARGRCPS